MSATFDDYRRIDALEVPEGASLRRLDHLARLLDTAVPIPFTGGARIGLDALLGIVPVVGDAIAMLISGVLINEARLLGLPRRKLARMAVNTGLDAAIGAIPIAGDVFDVFFRANERNIKIIRRHLEKEGRLLDISRKERMV
jgi:hypothetical protein